MLYTKKKGGSWRRPRLWHPPVPPVVVVPQHFVTLPLLVLQEWQLVALPIRMHSWTPLIRSRQAEPPLPRLCMGLRRRRRRQQQRRQRWILSNF